MTGSGWTYNTKKAWVLSTTKGACKPEAAFFIDKNFTSVISNKGLNFKTVPAATPSKKGYTTGNYRVTADLLNVRKGAGSTYAKVKFKNMSANAQAKIKALNNGKAVDGYVKGLAFTVFEVKGKWGKTPSGWICLDYCEKIK